MDFVTKIFISWFPLLLVIWGVPIFLILRAQDVSKEEKLAWIIASVFISWACLILFYLLAPLKTDE